LHTHKHLAHILRGARHLLLHHHHHQFFDRLRLELLLGGKSQEKEEDEKEKEEEENLSLEQFLYFVGLALDLDDMDEYKSGYSPLEALISCQWNRDATTESVHDDEEM
jgi:hypothetical protein